MTIKGFFRWAIILAFIILIGSCEIKLRVNFKEWAAPHHGIVIDSWEETGRYSTYHGALIRFDNSDIQEVNTGRYTYNIGDSFTGQLETGFLGGLQGYAYSWNPPQWVFWYCVFRACFVIIGLFVGGILFLAYIFSTDKN